MYRRIFLAFCGSLFSTFSNAHLCWSNYSSLYRCRHVNGEKNLTKKALEKLKFLIPVLLTLLIMVIVESHPITVFSSPQKPHIVDVESPFMGQEMFIFLWQYRGMDFIIQSLFLFTAIISCITLLRTERGK